MLCSWIILKKWHSAQKSPIVLKLVSFVEIIKKLQDLKTSSPKLATLVTEQLFANAMVSAGLMAY